MLRAGLDRVLCQIHTIVTTLRACQRIYLIKKMAVIKITSHKHLRGMYRRQIMFFSPCYSGTDAKFKATLVSVCTGKATLRW